MAKEVKSAAIGKSISYFEAFKSTCFRSWIGWSILLLIISIQLNLSYRRVTQRIENFITLSPRIGDDDLNEFISYLDRMEILANVTNKEVEQYHSEGYLLIRNFYNQPAIEAMRFIIDTVNNNPSDLYHLSLNPKRRYCGFFLHPFQIIPAFRRLLQRELESGMAIIASKLLLSNEAPVEIGSILHSTLPECFGEIEQLRGNTHSDQNQGVFSIERKRTIGDNMLVTWTALDRLDNETISIELWPKSHRWQDDWYGPEFNESNYCSIYGDMVKNTLDGHTHPTLPSLSLSLNPGDVLFFQGFTFHRVTKSSACRRNTCRRITTRYVRGEDTAWRKHLLESTTWPFLSWIPLTEGLLVKDTKGEFDLTEGKFADEEMKKPPMIPNGWSWLMFWLDSKLRGGMKPDQIVNLCEHAEEDNFIRA